jgi:hypothetical protein
MPDPPYLDASGTPCIAAAILPNRYCLPRLHVGGSNHSAGEEGAE